MIKKIKIRKSILKIVNKTQKKMIVKTYSKRFFDASIIGNVFALSVYAVHLTKNKQKREEKVQKKIKLYKINQKTNKLQSYKP